jgi:hypothetical protein
MRRGAIAAIALVLLVGCGTQANKSASDAAQKKWKGAPYRLALDAKAPKPNPVGVTIPPVNYTGNPEALESRAILVMRFTAGPANQEPVQRHMIGEAVDIHGAEGTLPADYMNRASKSLSDYFTSSCIQGKVDMTMALARSSLSPGASDAQLDAKLISDWLPFSVVYKKKPHAKC